MRSIKEMDKRLDEREQEIERLQEDIGNYVNIVLHDRKEIDRLHSIIKEVREYMNTKVNDNINDIYEILDRVGDKK